MGWYTQMVNAMALLYNCTSLLPSLRAQILTSVVYTVYRAFVFSMISTFNAQVGGRVRVGLGRVSFPYAAIVTQKGTHGGCIPNHSPKTS
jgi:hypothetical protein